MPGNGPLARRVLAMRAQMPGFLHRRCLCPAGPGGATLSKLPETATRWRFSLRKGIKFHNGEDFSADDVVFSAHRALADGSDVKTRLPGDVKVVKVDDHTVDFVLSGPNPILHYEWDTWYILSRKWIE